MITIMYRDINGNRNAIHFDSFDLAYRFSLGRSEEDEILCVFISGACVYSQLTCTETIDWEDLVGFFA